jgi:hypothetical protein
MKKGGEAALFHVREALFGKFESNETGPSLT